MKTLVLLTISVLAASALWAEDPRNDLAKALDYGKNLLLVRQLDPNAEDLIAMVNTSRALVRLEAESGKAYEATLTQGQRLLRAEKQWLLEGITPLKPEDEKALAALRLDLQQQTERKFVAADAQLRLLGRRLSPETGGLVQWTRPVDFPAPPAEDLQIERLRLLAARLDQAARMLDRIRYLDAANYVTSRVGRLREYLQDHGYRDNTRDMDDALDFMFRLCDEGRLVPEDRWEEQLPILAARTLQYLGELQDPETAPGQTRPVSWWDIYNLLSDPQTPALLGKLLNTLQGAPPVAGAGAPPAAGNQ